MIERPEVEYDDATHTYTLGGQTLAGVSTVAKIGGAEDTWGIASAWGFRIGYEGAHTLLGKDSPWDDADALRTALRSRGLTPWSKRDQAAARGNWVHDVLEQLAQNGTVPDVTQFPAEIRGHAQCLMAWWLALRPSFIATEVQVASVTHGFAGRYDLRVEVEAAKLVPALDPVRDDTQARRIRELAGQNKAALCLMDLKTSKGIYPTSHYPQLEGYEIAGTEMGYPATDCRCVIQTNPTGEWAVGQNLGVSWSTADDFLGLLAAHRAIRRIKDADPEKARERAAEQALLGALPATSRQIANLQIPELAGMDSRAIGRTLGKLKKRGRTTQESGVWSPAP